jgi:glucose/arabinose dehydrogenase
MSTRRNASIAVAMLACLAALVTPALAGATTLPAGFSQTTAISGLNRPTDVEIAPNGRLFVAERSGIVKTYTSVADTTATVAADLRTQVHNFSARGLMSLAVDPAFPTNPYIYVYYNLDAKIGGTPPLYGTAGQTNDSCAKAAGGKDENCIAAVRVSRLQIAGETMTGPEQVLVEDYCHQYPFHTGGGLEFGADGYLYVSGSDGSTAQLWDYGQTGTPANPCGDPPGAVGSLLTPPTSEGGRLRVQDLRTSGDPLGLDGSVIRIDPATGAGAPGNPLAGSASANERRILAYGLRDSVRIAIRPGTNDVWVTDRGGGYWEEFNRLQAPGTSVLNFGYPCYEGGIDANGNPYTRIRPASDKMNLDICENLYRAGNQTAAPYWGYDHELPVVPGEACTKDSTGSPAGSLLTGVSFYPVSGGNFPSAYRGALFFSDRERDCIYALLPGSDGLPQRGKVVLFAAGAMHPMDIEVLPGGDMLYVDQAAYEVKRISYTAAGNQDPTAVATSSINSGIAPLSVAFDGSGSSDPDGDALTYEWDLDGDGAFDDSTAAKPSFTYTAAGTYAVTLRVSDGRGGSSTAVVTITVATGGATTLQFTPDQDARVEQANSGTNYGSSSSLLVRGGTSLVAESYLRFQVSGITGPIQSAKLRVRALSNGTVDGPAVFTASNTWSQSTINWNTRPARDTTVIGDVGAIAANATVDYDVKPVVSSNGTITFALIGTSTDGVDFASRENSDATKRPRLIVTLAG